jgi:protein TonB
MSTSALPLPTGSTLPPQRLQPAALALSPLPVTAALLPAGRRSDLAPAERRWLVAGVAALHLLALWGLLQVGAVQQTLRELAPLMVDFISAEQPPKPVPPPPPPPQQQLKRKLPVQTAPMPVIAAAPQPDAAPAPQAFVVPEPVLAVATPAPPAPPLPVTAPSPAPVQAPAPKAVAASALRYAVLPPVEMPLASRRLGETGTVLLRVVFDTRGQVKQVSVHRSSGFARLDEQALAAMRRARITPFLDNGQAIEVSALAPLAYELD